MLLVLKILMIQMGILLSPMMLLRMILFKLRRKVKMDDPDFEKAFV